MDTDALRVTMRESSLKVVQGDYVVLPCSFFTSSPLSRLNVIWTLAPVSSPETPVQVWIWTQTILCLSVFLCIFKTVRVGGGSGYSVHKHAINRLIADSKSAIGVNVSVNGRLYSPCDELPICPPLTQSQLG